MVTLLAMAAVSAGVMLLSESPPRVYEAGLIGVGGEVAFGLELREVGETLVAHVVNGQEKIVVPTASLVDGVLTLDFDYFGSKVVAQSKDGGETFEGEWAKRRSKGEWTRMAFVARPAGVRTLEIRPLPEGLAGRYGATFAKEAEGAVFILGGEDARELRGTFLTTTGDYRFLAGSVESVAADGSGVFRLSCFDGAHAFLFRAGFDGKGSLTGEFWSGATYHDTWRAERDESAALPDPFGLTRFTGSAEGLNDLSFPDVNGTMRTMREFAGRPRVIELFGTWCPNCLDATRVLTRLQERYGPRGLAVIGLAFETTGDEELDRAQVAVYAERHRVPYTMLVAGSRDKAQAARAFPMLDKLRAYPTFIFVDESGKVRGVYTGFSGPATGEEHERLVRSFERMIESMLPD
ncbi:MAG: TlpA disulfide reductase family protein [Planctomycetota bacterium]|nr:TlpA disulfide reductase family protein [Planctomycetota bacterium]